MAGGHSLRGSGLGSRSLEDEKGIEFAARQEIGFDCPQEHHFEITFAMEADLPAEWECPRCGEVSTRTDGTQAVPKDEKHVRTHWDMLRERRSIEDLQVLLTERLEEIRSKD